MLRKSLCARLVACAAGAAMLLPAMPVSAAPQSAQQVRQGNDVVLSGGKLSGKLLNANGKAVEGAVVAVSKDGKVVARTVTKADGSYTVAGLSSGSYNMSIGEAQFPVRMWNKETAPAAAKSQLNVSQTAVRGQLMDDCGCPIWTNIAIAGVAVAALTVGIISLTDDDDQPASP
jgi:hypothetical protein